MKQLFLTLSNHLKTAVPAIKWIDADYGQADNYELRAALAFPALLIRTAIVPEDIGGGAQQNRATVTLRVVFNPATVRTSVNTPDQVRQSALDYLDTADQVYLAMQGKEIGDYDAFECTSKEQESRSDGLLVVRLTFTTGFWDFRPRDE